MYNFENFNRKSTIREDVEIKDMEFKGIKEFCGKTILVDGFLFTNGKYGKQVVVIGNGYKINMPSRAVEVFEQIEKDDNALQAMFEGHLAIKDIKMADTKNGTTTVYKLANK